MCAGALVLARVACVVFGATDPKGGAARTLYRILDDPRLNHQAEVVGGVLEAESRELLQEFFRKRRGDSGQGMNPSPDVVTGVVGAGLISARHGERPPNDCVRGRRRVYSRAERWPSGRRRRSRKAVAL